MFDLDGDHYISVEEMKLIFHGSALGFEDHVTEDDDNEVWRKIMQDADTNNDGKISYEEFYNQMVKLI